MASLGVRGDRQAASKRQASRRSAGPGLLQHRRRRCDRQDPPTGVDSIDRRRGLDDLLGLILSPASLGRSVDRRRPASPPHARPDSRFASRVPCDCPSSSIASGARSPMTDDTQRSQRTTAEHDALSRPADPAPASAARPPRLPRAQPAPRAGPLLIIFSFFNSRFAGRPNLGTIPQQTAVIAAWPSARP